MADETRVRAEIREHGQEKVPPVYQKFPARSTVTGICLRAEPGTLLEHRSRCCCLRSIQDGRLFVVGRPGSVLLLVFSRDGFVLRVRVKKDEANNDGQ